MTINLAVVEDFINDIEDESASRETGPQLSRDALNAINVLFEKHTGAARAMAQAAKNIEAPPETDQELIRDAHRAWKDLFFARIKAMGSDASKCHRSFQAAVMMMSIKATTLGDWDFFGEFHSVMANARFKRPWYEAQRPDIVNATLLKSWSVMRDWTSQDIADFLTKALRVKSKNGGFSKDYIDKRIQRLGLKKKSRE